MSDQTFTGALYTYPWDLADEGVDAALSRIIDLSGCRELLLTPCYHRSIYFLPHNPRRPVYFGENGAIYFSPDQSRYSRTRIQPRISKEVTDPGYFDRMVEAIDRRGLHFAAWIVYTFQDHLSEQYPEFAKHDAFGTPYVGQLSTAPPDVRNYFLALTSEILERYQPTTVVIESLMRRGFGMPSKRRAEIAPRPSFLLALCFNPATMENARAANMDPERFRREVVEWLRPRLARDPSEEDLLPVSGEWIAAAFEGQLARYLEIGNQHTTALWLQVADAIHASGARIQTDLATPERAWSNDLDPAINPHIDRLAWSLTEKGEEAREQVRELIAQIAPEGEVFVRLKAEADPAPLVEEVGEAIAAGAGGGIFYNYGLLREDQLRAIGTALLNSA